jgi:hypothetical protein
MRRLAERNGILTRRGEQPQIDPVHHARCSLLHSSHMLRPESLPPIATIESMINAVTVVSNINDFMNRDIQPCKIYVYRPSYDSNQLKS